MLTGSDPPAVVTVMVSLRKALEVALESSTNITALSPVKLGPFRMWIQVAFVLTIKVHV